MPAGGKKGSLFFFKGQSLVDGVAHVYQLVDGPRP